MAGTNLPGYRAAQVYDWVHRRGASSFDEMDNLPKNLRRELAEIAFISAATIREKNLSPDGTIKYLFGVANHNIIDGNEVQIESVLMNYRHGAALCVSTQAGCAMGCAFCASGKGGLLRDLSAGEMLAQVLAATKDSALSNITLMGSGEPLANYDNVLKFIRLLNAPEGQGIGQRRITLSTCGLTDGILALAEEKLQITLAVSLHSADDAFRAQIMPVARAYPLDGLLDACRVYVKKTGRRVSFEYAMIMGKNDRADQAAALAARLSKILCHVNLLPVNAVSDSGKRGLRPSLPGVISAFRDVLLRRGIETTVRRSLGSGINAACGQLLARRGGD